MHLPGEIHERIGDLRSGKGLSQKQLSEIIGIVPSQLSRIESGKIQSISSDILIKLASCTYRRRECGTVQTVSSADV